MLAAQHQSQDVPKHPWLPPCRPLVSTQTAAPWQASLSERGSWTHTQHDWLELLQEIRRAPSECLPKAATHLALGQERSVGTVPKSTFQPLEKEKEKLPVGPRGPSSRLNLPGRELRRRAKRASLCELLL